MARWWKDTFYQCSGSGSIGSVNFWASGIQSGSISQRYGSRFGSRSRSGSGSRSRSGFGSRSFYYQAKIVRKTISPLVRGMDLDSDPDPDSDSDPDPDLDSDPDPSIIKQK